MSDRPRIFSAMQPTGELHLGNYLGALRQWVATTRSGEFDPIYCIVDAHATTVEYDPREMPTRTFETALTYLAAGLDPERAIVFVQSDVAEHLELTWYLGTVTAMGDLHRMTQFKEKSEQHKQNINSGLFTYPVLMAADILLYRATVVPVGNDQVQHLELAREIGRRFNARFGAVFPEPVPRLSTTPRIMGLDGKSKMSKTRGNTIGLFDEPRAVEKKLKGAFTDEAKLRRGDPGRPEICNIFTIHRALTPESEVAAIDRDCRTGALGCGECKQRCAAVVVEELAPIRTRGLELKANRVQVIETLREGAARARAIASRTMADVRRAMGLSTAGME
ncbi:MAG: tryptophan--tRNA ligase [Polyangiaceae bacterium]|nr:tryptophan--tRNA ligase [Polyangiaceae bacterium]